MSFRDQYTVHWTVRQHAAEEPECSTGLGQHVTAQARVNVKSDGSRKNDRIQNMTNMVETPRALVYATHVQS